MILVSLDTLRADRVGAARAGVPLTPRLDALAARAARFTDARSVSGHTLTSHKSLLSGRLPMVFLTAFSQARAPGAPPLDSGAYFRAAFRAWPVPSVASRLREVGIAAAAFTDGSYLEPRFGLGDGFDPYASERLGLDGQVALARRWLESSGGRPHFLFLHTYDVHCPYNPPARVLRLFEATCTGRLRFSDTCGKDYFNRLELAPEEREHVSRHYDAGVRYADEQMGRFVDWLEETGRLADTALIVTSDHGESLGERRFVGHGQLYDNQLRVPLLVYLPGAKPAVIDAPVSGVDVATTILDLLLGRVPEGLDGLSLLPLIRGGGPVPAFEGRTRIAAVAVTEGRSNTTRLRKLALLDPWGRKWITDPDAGRSELYDLVSDPDESRDLASAHVATVGSFREQTARLAVEPLRGLGDGPGDLRREGLSTEEVERLRALGYGE